MKRSKSLTKRSAPPGKSNNLGYQGLEPINEDGSLDIISNTHVINEHYFSQMEQMDGLLEQK